MNAAAEQEANQHDEVRAKLENVIEKAKDACERLEQKSAAAAHAANQAVHKHPYPAVGIAFGLGVLAGALAMWRSRD